MSDFTIIDCRPNAKAEPLTITARNPEDAAKQVYSLDLVRSGQHANNLVCRVYWQEENMKSMVRLYHKSSYRYHSLLHLKRFSSHQELKRVVRCAGANSMPYSWTTDQDVLVDNAIIVSIGGADAAMIAFGSSYSSPAAAIAWHSMVTAEGFFAAGSETDFHDVAEALARAEMLRKQMGADRVVISIRERGMWRDEWGELAEWEGIR